MKSFEKENNSIDLKQEFRNLGALIEHNNHRVDAMVEQFGEFHTKFETIDTKLDVHTEMLGKLLVDNEDHKVKFVDINERLEDIEVHMVE